MDFDDSPPEVIAAAIAEEIGRDGQLPAGRRRRSRPCRRPDHRDAVAAGWSRPPYGPKRRAWPRHAGPERPMTTIHVRYEILDDPRSPHPDSPPDAASWGVRAVGLPEEFSACGVGDTLDEALDDLSRGPGAARRRFCPRRADPGNRGNYRGCCLMPIRLSGREIIKALAKDGLTAERISGGHHVMRHPHGHHVSVPVHANRPLSAGTLASICRTVGLTASQLRDLLFLREYEPGSPGALLHRGPLRTAHARSRAHGPSKPLGRFKSSAAPRCFPLSGAVCSVGRLRVRGVFACSVRRWACRGRPGSPPRSPSW